MKMHKFLVLSALSPQKVQESRLVFKAEKPEGTKTDQAQDQPKKTPDLVEKEIEARQAESTRERERASAEPVRNLETRYTDKALSDFWDNKDSEEKFTALLENKYVIETRNKEKKQIGIADFTPEEMTSFIAACSQSEKSDDFMQRFADKFINENVISAYHINKTSISFLIKQFNTEKGKETLRKIVSKLADQSATRISELIELVIDLSSILDKKAFLTEFIPKDKLEALITGFIDRFSATALRALIKLEIVDLKTVLEKASLKKKAELLPVLEGENKRTLLENLVANLGDIISKEPQILDIILANLTGKFQQSEFLEKALTEIKKTPESVKNISTKFIKALFNLDTILTDLFKEGLTPLINSLTTKQKKELVNDPELDNNVAKRIFDTMDVDTKLEAAGFRVEGTSIVFNIPESGANSVKRSFKKSVAEKILKDITADEQNIKLVLTKVKLIVYKQLLDIITKDGSINTNEYNIGANPDDFRKSNAELAFQVARLEELIKNHGVGVDLGKVETAANNDMIERVFGKPKKHKTFEITTPPSAKLLTPKGENVKAPDVENYLGKVYDEMGTVWGKVAPFTKETFISLNKTKTVNLELKNGTELTLPFINKTGTIVEKESETGENMSQKQGYIEAKINIDDARTLQKTKTFEGQTIEAITSQNLYVDNEGNVYLANGTMISEKADLEIIKNLEVIKKAEAEAKSRAERLGLVKTKVGDRDVYVDGAGTTYTSALGGEIPETVEPVPRQSEYRNLGDTREKAAENRENYLLNQIEKKLKEIVEKIKSTQERSNIDIEKTSDSPLTYKITVDNDSANAYYAEFDYNPASTADTVSYRLYKKEQTDADLKEEIDDWAHKDSRKDDFDIEMEAQVDTHLTVDEGDIVKNWDHFENRWVVEKVMTQSPFGTDLKKVPKVAAAIISENNNEFVTMDDILDEDMLKKLKIDTTNIPKELLSLNMGEFKKFLDKYNKLEEGTQKNAIRNLLVGCLKLFKAFQSLRYNPEKPVEAPTDLNAAPTYTSWEDGSALEASLENNLGTIPNKNKISDFEGAKTDLDNIGITLPDSMKEITHSQFETLKTSSDQITESFRNSDDAYDVVTTIERTEKKLKREFTGIEGTISFNIDNVLPLKFNSKEGFPLSENLDGLVKEIQTAKFKTFRDYEKYAEENYKAATEAAKERYERENLVQNQDSRESLALEEQFREMIRTNTSIVAQINMKSDRTGEDYLLKYWPDFANSKAVEEIMVSPPLNANPDTLTTNIVAIITERLNSEVDMDDLLDEDILKMFNIDKTGLPPHLFKHDTGALADWTKTYKKFEKSGDPKDKAIAEKMKTIMKAMIRLLEAFKNVKYDHEKDARESTRKEDVTTLDAYTETSEVQKRTVKSLTRMFRYLKQKTGSDFSEESGDDLNMENMGEGGTYTELFRNFFNPESAVAMILDQVSEENDKRELVIDNEKLANVLNNLIKKGRPVVIRRKAVEALKKEGVDEPTMDQLAAKETRLREKYKLMEFDGTRMPESLEEISGTDGRSAENDAADFMMESLKTGFVVEELSKQSKMEREINKFLQNIAREAGTEDLPALKEITIALLAQGLPKNRIIEVNRALAGSAFINFVNKEVVGGGGSINIPLGDGATLSVFGGLQSTSGGGITGTGGLSFNFRVFQKGRDSVSISTTITPFEITAGASYSREGEKLTVTAFLSAGFSWKALAIPIGGGLDFNWGNQAQRKSIKENIGEAMEDEALKDIWKEWDGATTERKAELITQSQTIRTFVGNLKTAYPEVFEGNSALTPDDYDYVIACLDEIIKQAKARGQDKFTWRDFVSGLTIAAHTIIGGATTGALIGLSAGPFGAIVGGAIGATIGVFAGLKFKIFQKTIFIPSRTQKAKLLKAGQEARREAEVLAALKALESGELDVDSQFTEQTGRLIFNKEGEPGFVSPDKDFDLSKYFTGDPEGLKEKMNDSGLELKENGKMLELIVKKQKNKDVEILIDPSIKKELALAKHGDSMYIEGAIHKAVITVQRTYFPRPQGDKRASIKDVIVIRTSDSVKNGRDAEWVKKHSTASAERLQGGQWRIERGANKADQENVLDLDDTTTAPKSTQRMEQLAGLRQDSNELAETQKGMGEDLRKRYEAMGVISEGEFAKQEGMSEETVIALNKFFKANYGKLEKIMDSPEEVIAFIKSQEEFAKLGEKATTQAYRYVVYKYFTQLYPGGNPEKKETTLEVPGAELDLSALAPGSFVIETLKKPEGFETKITNSFHSVILDKETNTAFLLNHKGEVIRSFPEGRDLSTPKQKKALEVTKAKVKELIKKTIEANKKVIKTLERHKEFEVKLFGKKFSETIGKLNKKGIRPPLNDSPEYVQSLVTMFTKNMYEGLKAALQKTDPPLDYRTIALSPLETGGLLLSGSRTRERAGQKTTPNLAAIYTGNESTYSPEFEFGNGFLSLGEEYDQLNNYNLRDENPDRRALSLILHELASPLPAKPAENADKETNLTHYKNLLMSPLGKKISGSKLATWVFTNKEYDDTTLILESIKKGESLEKYADAKGKIASMEYMTDLLYDIRRAQLDGTTLRRNSRREGTNHIIEFDFRSTKIEGGAYSKCGNPSFYVNEFGTIKIYERTANADLTLYTEMTDYELRTKNIEIGLGAGVAFRQNNTPKDMDRGEQVIAEEGDNGITGGSKGAGGF